jgi:FAD/FMN-containing dehydrogenase
MLDISENAAESAWARAGAALAGDGDTTAMRCTITVPPAAGAASLGPLMNACADHDAPADVVWQADRGIIVLRCMPNTAPACDAILTELRTIACGSGGHCIAESVPFCEKTPGRVWGEDVSSPLLMRRMKTAFDPRAILSPGRLVGGV